MGVRLKAAGERLKAVVLAPVTLVSSAVAWLSANKLPLAAGAVVGAVLARLL